MSICPLPDSDISPEQTDPRGRFITTYSGVKFYINECNIEDIPFLDIAHSLSMNCRFNGHVDRFYSVAEHSILVSELVPEKWALWGLLHDISEAFVPDIPSPFKAVMSGFSEFEDRLMQKAIPHFGLEELQEGEHMPPEVKWIDTHIAADEAKALFTTPPAWADAFETVLDRLGMIRCYEPRLARMLFIARFDELMDRRR